MYAVIRTGGKQYRVAKDDVILIERLAGDNGALVEQTRGPKVIAFKKRRRKNSRRKRGHRQDLTKVRITSIVGA